MQKLYIMCGVAFSGKSTLAKKIAETKGAELVSQDSIWFEKKESMNLDWDSDEDWEMVQGLSRAEIERALKSGTSVVYDDISLTFADRERLRSLATRCQAEAVLVYLNTPQSIQEERQRRNVETGERHDVPQRLLDWGRATLETPQENENPFIYTPGTDSENWLKELP